MRDRFQLFLMFRQLSGYQVADDLVVVGDSWWLERHEYDGSEWWEYKEKPKLISEIKEVSHLAGGMWDKLAKLNKIEVKR